MASFPDFLNQKAPENYVAGVGRGATSFVTRSDLGPTHVGPTDEQMKAAIAKRAQQLQSKAEGEGKEGGGENEGEGRYQDPDNEVGLFAGGIYEKDDEEADKIWQEVDERMARRRQKQREVRERLEEDEYERQNPKIEAQFADLKRALGTVSAEEWLNLPDVKDMTGKTKRNREAQRQRFYAVPDTVLAAARDAGELGTTVADDGAASSRKDGTMTNFAQIGAARDKVLQAHLDQASQTTSGTSSVLGTSTSVDPKGYITSLNKLETAEKASVSDVDFARKLLKSAVESNPTSAPGWIAAARVEELAGKLVAARNVIARGCQHCPRSEDVWLENMRLNESRNAKVIAAEAIKANRRSVRLWVEAMKLESDVLSKKRVVRRALDHMPESEALWKEAVNLEENAEDARLLLAKATELIPASIDLWLALARLESPKNAKAVLNRARKAVPTSHEIWIAAARLQEQLGETSKGNVMRSAVQSLAKEGAMPKREEWLAEAEKCEAEGAVQTCGNIVRETVGWGLDEDDDRKDTWMEDARESTNRGRYATARAIYGHALQVFVNSRTLWLAAAELERSHGSREAQFGVLERAVEAVPHSEVLWMMLAKERLAAGHLDEARRVLGRAFSQNPNNEDIWLAAVKLEAENGFVDRARELLATARENAPTDRVWMRSVVFERQHGADGGSEAALTLVQEALQLFPGAAKLWMLKGQIYAEDLGRVAEARAAYAAGVKAVPGSVALWLLLARLEEAAGAVVKARSVLDRGRQAVPRSPELWCELVRIERRAGNVAQARALMATALRQMPRSGLLWAERIWQLEPRTQRKPLSLEAIRQVDDDPLLFVAVARVFWAERKLERAQNWFEKALVLDPDAGDAWAWYYRFLLQHGTAEKLAEVVAKCVQNDPRHGEHWQAVAKNPKNAGKTVEDVLKLVAAGLS
ncbi:mRNA splicing factor [Grosmannia clavigera kw1407]|uniref:mRNA splicing factor n=1 Tax=Grosmannia clavigera (strain kw1407 / UAMH 11150) TaxID=655863 RepID=F0XFW6_GROCL|nr:mRNA splicing factor [Grosmannia clavigera kw1407]EFX03542.1 mRNA splicing factor [Grosmannia clavigera kw1407]